MLMYLISLLLKFVFFKFQCFVVTIVLFLEVKYATQSGRLTRVGLIQFQMAYQLPYHMNCAQNTKVQNRREEYKLVKMHLSVGQSTKVSPIPFQIAQI